MMIWYIRYYMVWSNNYISRQCRRFALCLPNQSPWWILMVNVWESSSTSIGLPEPNQNRSHETDETVGPSKVYDKIDVKMDQRRLKQREKKMREQIKECRTSGIFQCGSLHSEYCWWKKNPKQPPGMFGWYPVKNLDFNYQPPSTGELSFPDFWLPSTVFLIVVGISAWSWASFGAPEICP